MSKLEPAAWMRDNGTLSNKYDGIEPPPNSVPLYAIPEGYVLVPKEPTEAMCRAGEICPGGSSGAPWIDGAYTPENVELIYKAMIDAAQGEKG